MNDKKKNIIYFILIEVVTAVFFLIIGSLLPFIFGVANTRETVIEYVPVTATSTSTTSSAESVKTTETSSVKTTSKGGTTTTTKKTSADAQITEKINLNTATIEDLMTIKGIGETYARRIIEYRDSIGGFTYMEQLKEVEGIGEGRYAAWTPYLTLDD